ncbi:AIPR family protein [Pseudoxanthomonas sp. Root630]|uniref:AIPR family protein n=1 Tax=Pseudoxanthomonas sp. Root630 TaxID=1736574 RepID=UPI0007038C2F|nr:AIPR family protein [Pseudoxanthomonas sp. Root630]KRA41482.1 abortive phage infection protein [Pseudoxanthomonas sp. Root630]
MELIEFLVQTRAEVSDEIAERMTISGTPYPYPELVFSEIVMRHMEDVGMTYEPQVCYYDTKVGNANIKLSGYSVSEDDDRLDLFVSIYMNAETLQSVPDSITHKAAEQCLRFLSLSAQGKLASTMDPSNDAHELAVHIENGYAGLDEIRIYVLTDGQVKAKNFKSREINGKTVRLEVMDIERLHRHWSEGKPRDELVVNFDDVAGGPLPCVYIEGNPSTYDYAMTVFPGDVLRFLYEKYGARLLEANVRSFLSATGKVNKGIQATLRSDPEKFVAYNNGIVIVADEARLGQTKQSGPGIAWLKGMQIVNGGQTTASIYFTKKKYSEIDLGKVRVPAKVVVLKTDDPAAEEAMISDISRYANSQNTVKQSDLSANSPFHVELEKLSNRIYCPDGVGRWFYERAAGSYTTMLAREGSTPAKYRNLKTVVVPPARRLTKTDLAKFLNAWDGRPDLASLGGQKNFARFMDEIRDKEEQGVSAIPDVQGYKRMIAKVILFKRVHSLVRPMFPAFQGNVAIYIVSMISRLYASKVDLDKIWEQQDVSDAFKSQIRIWAVEVNQALHASANGRMISEWAKKEECWVSVQKVALSSPGALIPEILPVK